MADAKNPLPMVPMEESELDQYVEKEPSKWEDFLNRQLRRSPWWAISFLVHIIAMLVLWSWPYHAQARETVVKDIPIDIVPDTTPEVPPEPPEPPEVENIEEPLDVPIEDIPISPEPVSKDDPGPDLGLDPTEDIMKDVERPFPSIDPPSNTPVFGVESQNAPAYNKGIYSLLCSTRHPVRYTAEVSNASSGLP